MFLNTVILDALSIGNRFSSSSDRSSLLYTCAPSSSLHFLKVFRFIFNSLAVLLWLKPLVCNNNKALILNLFEYLLLPPAIMNKYNTSIIMNSVIFNRKCINIINYINIK